MSTRYKSEDRVPTEVLAKRLIELSTAVVKGDEEMLREFNMRIPAELDRDADLVLSQSARRLAEYGALMMSQKMSQLAAPVKLKPMSEAPTDRGEIFAYHTETKTFHQVRRMEVNEHDVYWEMRCDDEYCGHIWDYLGWIPLPEIDFGER